MSELKNTIIYLIGIPAVGKYTTASAIARRTGAKLVDNHLINNPIFSVAHVDGTARYPFPTGCWKYMEKIRRAVLGFIREFGDPEDSYIFTNVMGWDEIRPFRQIERLAISREALFVPVWIKCSVITPASSQANRPRSFWITSDLFGNKKRRPLPSSRLFMDKLETGVPHSTSLRFTVAGQG